MNKPLIPLLVLLCLLVSCAPASPTQTPTATVSRTHLPPPTFTPKPTATEAPEQSAFALSSLDLNADLENALRAHPGLEQSIKVEPDGGYSASVVVLGTEGTQAIRVLPETLTQNITSENPYARTAVLQAEDGRRLFWIDEYRGWYAKPASGDIIIPTDAFEISTRIGIAEHSEDFSPEALSRWVQKDNGNTKFYYESHQVNAITDERKKFIALVMGSYSDSDLTLANTPVQVLPDIYTMVLSDGSEYKYFQLKWLDPEDPRNPKGDEWKIINIAIGTEISSNEANMATFLRAITETKDGVPVRKILPILRAEDGFFGYPNVSGALPISQPSLDKIYRLSSYKLWGLPSPVDSEYNLNMDYWLNDGWDRISAQNPLAQQGLSNSNPDYDDNILPDDIQILLFPSLIITR